MPYNADGSKKKNPTKQDWQVYHLRKGPKKKIGRSGARGGSAIGGGGAAAGGGGG
jgi:hypothetical protein